LNTPNFHLLLADDDPDDRMFFGEALNELPVQASLKTVQDGQQLMDLLMNPEEKPDILFLDLNMPRKTGYQCLSEIRSHEKLKQLPVIIFSTSLNADVLSLLYQEGANHYIRKPGDFTLLKTVILEALKRTTREGLEKRSQEEFVIQV
jgi:CheY-like chemotaxis protein